MRKEYLQPETKRLAVWNLLAHRSEKADPAVEARLSEKAAVTLYD
jgi:hypothetical protein